jgi:oxygen-independent coproporphyrinogen-3 oxidase
MAGIYIHIPFCKSKCGYCDFYSIANTNNLELLLKAIEKEIFLQKNYLNREPIETIYFGGGTPSLLNANQISSLTENIYSNFQISENPEITLEANPDDLSDIYLNSVKSKTKINRLSIGIQSFYDEDLELMNRRHNSQQAIDCVKKAQNSGFNNISVDLIYGLPNQTIEKWEENVDKVLDMNIQHISAYHLTYEKGTKFYKLLKEKQILELNENISLEQFKILIDKTKSKGFEHYEISNYALPGLYSKHNTSYWQQMKYLGLGPSAHSFDLNSRQWNFSNIHKYINFLQNNKIPAEIEQLDEQTKYNEYIMTSLRTMWGVNIKYIVDNFSLKYQSIFLKIAEKYISIDLLQNINYHYVLTENGIFVSDSIISDFFVV